MMRISFWDSDVLALPYHTVSMAVHQDHVITGEGKKIPGQVAKATASQVASSKGPRSVLILNIPTY